MEEGFRGNGYDSANGGIDSEAIVFEVNGMIVLPEGVIWRTLSSLMK